MVEVILEGGLLRFDGEVIELFSDQGHSDRYHVCFVKEMELEAGRKGITLINLRYGKNGRSGFSGWIVPHDNAANAKALVDAVHAAKPA